MKACSPVPLLPFVSPPLHPLPSEVSFRGLTSLATDSSAVLPCRHRGFESLFLPFGMPGLPIGLLAAEQSCVL